MRIVVAVTPEEVRAAEAYGKTLAHVAYRIGPDSTLLRQNLLLQIRGGLLSVSDREAPVIEQPEALCAAVLRECGRRNYSGVLLDFEERSSPDRLAFAARLGQTLAKSRRTLYLPESYRSGTANTVTLLNTAVSGGNFEQYLREEVQRLGGGRRVGLDVQRLRMDFRLPERTGEGTPLTEQELRALMEREGAPVFFSPDLCARYFTYTRKEEPHFVLFDDADTLRRKLLLGQALGISAAFFMWPEVADIAGALLG